MKYLIPFLFLTSSLSALPQVAFYTPSGTLPGPTTNPSTGNVGIGTTATSYNLHVVSTNPTVSSFQYNGDVNYPRLNVVGSPTKINLTLGASQTNATDLSFSTTTIADALIIKGNGFV